MKMIIGSIIGFVIGYIIWFPYGIMYTVQASDSTLVQVISVIKGLFEL